jgi:hypothetical protein
MNRRLINLLTGLALLIGALTVQSYQPAVLAQQDTPVVPTVTSTPYGPYIIVNSDQDQINVRSGPNVANDKIGVLLSGQKAPALGRYDVWILIEYPGVPGGQGWVYGSLVSLFGGEVPEVEPPSTPTPLYTMTIDPTLAAQFIITIEPTRLPTFTPPAPLVNPTLPVEDTGSVVMSKLPVGMIIIGLAILGAFFGLLSLLRGR